MNKNAPSAGRGILYDRCSDQPDDDDECQLQWNGHVVA